MNKNKAFTLVELLGVFTLMGIILLIMVPNVTQLLNKSKKDTNTRFLNDIFLATEAYLNSSLAENNPIDMVGGKAFVSVHELIYNGYLKSITIDPSTNQKVSPTNTVVATKTASGKITYEYYDHDITLNGYNKNGLLQQFDAYTKPINNVLKDVSGNNNDGRMVGFDSASGYKGDRIIFDGKDDGVLSTEINPNYVTVSAYFMIPKVTTQEQYVIGNYETGGFGFTFDYENNNKISFIIYCNGAYRQVHSTNNYELNKWYHVVGTYDGTTMKLYIDGVLNNTLNISGVIGVPQSNTVLALGANPVGSNKLTSHAMSIKSTKIYDRALNETEVKNDYQLEKERYDDRINKYIQEGLILQYDGYISPNGGLWEDMSPSKNHSTVPAGYTWKDNALISDNTVKMLTTINNFTVNNNMTFSITFKLDNKTATHPLFAYRQSMGSDLFIYNSSNDIIMDLSGSQNRRIIFNKLQVNKIYRLDVTISGATETTYINGKKIGVTTAQVQANKNIPLNIFGETSNNYSTPGSIYGIQVYNKVLTDKEIEANYKLDQQRFGI